MRLGLESEDQQSSTAIVGGHLELFLREEDELYFAELWWGCVRLSDTGVVAA